MTEKEYLDLEGLGLYDENIKKIISKNSLADSISINTIDAIINDQLIESSDELGFNSIYTLIIEVMGRHSNITLVRERDNKIMECIKHIAPSMNSYRVLYPGITYKYPPESTKINPFSFNDTTLQDFVNKNF